MDSLNLKQHHYFQREKNVLRIQAIHFVTILSLPHSSEKSNVIETGLSDFHKMTTTVIKVIFHRLKLSDLETEKDTHMKPATRDLSDCIILIHLGINDLLPKKGS